MNLQGISDESWGLDNVSLSNGVVLFEDDFEGGAQPNWSHSQTDASTQGVFSEFSGRFTNDVQMLSVSGLTSGTTYQLRFDLYIFDSWDGMTSPGPDYFEVAVDGTTLFSEVFSNFADRLSSGYGSLGEVPLQIVPVLAGMTGSPGANGAYTLTGSGFMEGASEVRVGDETRVDEYTNAVYGDVNGARNDTYRLFSRHQVEGPVRVTTAGGFSEVSGPTWNLPSFVEFTGIVSEALVGTAANAGVASANTGQTITLQGRGFTTSTLVQFTARDDGGTDGVLTRTGTPSADGNELTIAVPALARTGAVRVLGEADTFGLQVVPTLRAMGGALAAGETVLLDARGWCRVMCVSRWAVKRCGARR